MGEPGDGGEMGGGQRGACGDWGQSLEVGRVTGMGKGMGASHGETGGLVGGGRPQALGGSPGMGGGQWERMGGQWERPGGEEGRGRDPWVLGKAMGESLGWGGVGDWGGDAMGKSPKPHWNQ